MPKSLAESQSLDKDAITFETFYTDDQILHAQQ